MNYFFSLLFIELLLILGEALLKNRQAKKFLLLCSSVMFSVITANRSMLIPDTIPYYEFFLSQTQITSIFAQNDTRFEIGFVFLTRLIAKLTNNYTIYFFILSIFMLFLAYLAFKDQQLILVTFAAFLSFYGVYFTSVILRAGFAILLFCVAIKQQTKLKKIIFLIASVLFHYSAIFMAIIFFIVAIFRIRKLKPILIIFTFLICLMLYATGFTKSILELIIRVLEKYKDNYIILKVYSYLISYVEKFKFGISMRYLLNVMVMLYSIWFRKSKKLEYTNKEKTILTYIITGMIVESLFGNMMIVGRMTDFSNIFNIYSVSSIATIGCQKKAEFTFYDKRCIVSNDILERIINYLIILCFVCLNTIFIIRICL